MSKKLIIAATTARGYAQAAVACGYEVIALDAFADADTQRIATHTFKLKMHSWQLDVEDFKRMFLEMASQLDLENVDGFLYGSLFDDTPELLAWIAQRVPLIGNTPEVLRAAKDFSFFKRLDDLQIAHPEVCLEMPVEPSNWLVKQIGGNGGTHIRPANLWKTSDYFQQKVVGEPISMLFVADGKTAQLIGFNRQFVAPTEKTPYRFAGAVNNVAMQPSIYKAFEHAAQQLTLTLNLRGINSLDAVLENEGLDGEKLWMLELNPRLSATFHLYSNSMYPNLLDTHVQGCKGELVGDLPLMNGAAAQWILYADEAFETPLNFAWPAWVMDVPENGTKVAQHAPICTILAEAENAALAQTLVLQRAEKLKGMILK